MFPDTPRHQGPEPVHSVGVGAGVVQHYHSSMLYVVQPSLYRNKPGIKVIENITISLIYIKVIENMTIKSL